MAFLSSKTLKKRIPQETIISNFDPDRLKFAAYELSMGNQAYETKDETRKIYEEGEQIVIRPGQFAILITKETLDIPIDLIAFISIKFSIKLQGLVNVSGFHVDPGFKGRLKFAVYNAGNKNVVLSPDQPIFQIWFSKLDSSDKSNKYEGKHNNQTEITAEDVMDLQGHTASPSELANRVDKIENEFRTWKGIFYGLFIPLLILVLSVSFDSCSNSEKSKIKENNSTIIKSDSIKAKN